MLPNIVLVGFMGCGKSSVGRRLALITGHRMVDTDDLITRAAGRGIPEIFNDEGEEGFRKREAAALAGLDGVCGIVLATGGGIVLDPSNRHALRSLGVVAWLDADPDILFERASRSGRRPLLQTGNPRASFDELLAGRRALYGEVSDYRLDTGAMSHEDAASKLLEMAVRHHRQAD